MDKKQKWPRFFVKCKRRTGGIIGHFSEAWLEVPYDVGASGDPMAAMVWIGEEVNFQWQPEPQGVICYTQDHVKDLIGDEVYG